MIKFIAVLSILLVIGLLTAIFGLWLYGLVLSFSANVLIGLAFLLVPPLPVVTGFAEVLFNYNIPQEIINLLI